MELVDLKQQYKTYKADIDAAIEGVITTTSFINGEAVRTLEKQLQSYTAVNHAVLCSSGTDALLLAMMALGVKQDDEILVPAFTYVATASMMPLVGAKPIFVEVDPVSFNIDVSKIEEKITDRTVGIVPVSLYGQCADFDAINEIAARHGLWVMEDGAQSFGATYKGRKSCSLTRVATTSFFPAKPLGCYGDGGAIFTNDDELFAKLLLYRNHGQSKRYHHDVIGLNGRMDTLQAAIVSAKLNYFDDELRARNRIAKNYTEALSSCVTTPVINAQNISSWAQYTIRVSNRDEVSIHLERKGVPTAVHYPMPLPRQKAFAYLHDSSSYPVSDDCARTVLSLPMHPFLSDQEMCQICDAVMEVARV